MIQIFLADGRAGGSSEVVQEVLADLKRGEYLEKGNCCKRNRQDTRDGRGRWTGIEGSIRVPCGP